MTQKKTKTVRRTVIVLADNDLPVTTRALMWEAAGRSANRRVHRVERATPGPWHDGAGSLFLIDMELTCRGANRHDLTKFVQSYLPEVQYHFITE